MLRPRKPHTVASLFSILVQENKSAKTANMKSFIVLAVLVACAVAAPPSTNDKDAVVIRSDTDNIGVDGYNYAYETSNGISAQEQGQLQNAGTENEAIIVRGSFSYVGPDGVTYSVTYEAGPEGFQAKGDHIPQA